MKATRMRHGSVHMFITHRPTLTLQFHDFDLFRTCRTSSFCTVAWQLARFQLTERNRGPSAIAELLVDAGRWPHVCGKRLSYGRVSVRTPVCLSPSRRSTAAATCSRFIDRRQSSGCGQRRYCDPRRIDTDLFVLVLFVTVGFLVPCGSLTAVSF